MIDRKFERQVKTFIIENVKDFCTVKLQNHSFKSRIIHETSCAYTSQQNGVVERKIGLIQEKIEHSLFKVMYLFFSREKQC